MRSWKRRRFLLPPRGRPVCVLAATRSRARQLAVLLQEMGWWSVGWAVVPESCAPPPDAPRLRTGPSDTVLWEPSPWLLEIGDELPSRGDAIDLACGSGRNTIHLAHGRSGATYGVDILPDALAQARVLRADAALALAARREPGRPEDERALNARFHRADLGSGPHLDRWLPAGRWSLIVVFRYLDRGLLPRLQRALRPGGHLVYQTFLEEQRARKGSPRNDRHLLKPGELRDAFRSLTVRRYEEGVDEDGNALASLWASRP